MQLSRSESCRLLARGILLPAIAVFVMAGAAGCDSGTDDSGSASTADTGGSGTAQTSDNGFTLRGGDTVVDATTSSALLPAAPSGGVSFRLLGGWVDVQAAAAAGQETDEQAQRDKGLKSFGTLTLQVSTSAAEPGTYTLSSSTEGDQVAVVVIPAEEDLGLDSVYTSASGTLTLEAVEVKDDALKSVMSVVGTFDGTFVDDDGNERPFTGTFRHIPSK